MNAKERCMELAKAIAVKLTDAEWAELLDLAGDHTTDQWLYDALIRVNSIRRGDHLKL